MGRTSIIDGRMLDVTKASGLGRFFTSSVTFQSRAATQDAFGQETSREGADPGGTWTNVVGLTNLACTVGLQSGGEHRSMVNTSLHEDAQILLASYQPAVTTAMRAVVTGGLTYDILEIDIDPLNTATLLRVQRVTT